ncbi:MAG TPA: nuclear transport factor 2 family protein [Actinomycetota bacterium]|nr:nuclear transport factor 2 family protein [Actinomycetota bacterium]
MPSEADIRERLGWAASSEEHEKIRRLWIEHSKAEDARDLEGLIATLTPDCVYELVWSGERWKGHDGARRFYLELLTAFPDIDFDLQDIVIGPQGVFEVANVTGTHHGPWAGVEPDGRQKRFQVVIHFPWDPQAELFAGEKVYLGPIESA